MMPNAVVMLLINAVVDAMLSAARMPLSMSLYQGPFAASTALKCGHDVLCSFDASPVGLWS
jgi:hypothetical protein